jgi:hypothetical protein
MSQSSTADTTLVAPQTTNITTKTSAIEVERLGIEVDGSAVSAILTIAMAILVAFTVSNLSVACCVVAVAIRRNGGSRNIAGGVDAGALGTDEATD